MFVNVYASLQMATKYKLIKQGIHSTEVAFPIIRFISHRNDEVRNAYLSFIKYVDH